ncbi:secondary thiamine-phosphate synthase enzyme YjbQ [Anaerofustis sp.]|uniref:secondary thiamine-phosphate synthase enzyme YjbQ n=1 Tax=Anaerofustis sp. TaxID=1872517 RepID=UPI0025C53E5A|nr:secondary thiamine-phosphate synthase enzyme YjbQ [Anaerofustis sp.]
MFFEFDIRTDSENFHNITGCVKEAVKKSGVKNGICIVYSPHTTGGITINEAADPDVVDDMIYAFDKIFPDMEEFKHYEGNSSAHIKTSLVGNSETVIVEDGNLLLGTWQGIYFTEFDGPRRRKFYVKVLG